jgi:hypothetical protein
MTALEQTAPTDVSVTSVEEAAMELDVLNCVRGKVVGKSVLKWLVVMAARATTAHSGVLALLVVTGVLDKNAEVRALGHHAL